MIDLFATTHLAWMSTALCAQVGAPDAWFNRGHSEAQKVCDHCPVEAQCRNYAQHETDMGTRLDGVWGGTTEGQRRVTATRHRKEARAAARAAAAALQPRGVAS